MIMCLVGPKIITLILDSRGTYPHFRQRISQRLKSLDSLSFPPEDEQQDQQEKHQHTRIISHYLLSWWSHLWSDAEFVMLASFLRFCEMSLVGWIWYPLWLWSLWLVGGFLFIGEMIPAAAPPTTLGVGHETVIEYLSAFLSALTTSNNVTTNITHLLANWWNDLFLRRQYAVVTMFGCHFFNGDSIMMPDTWMQAIHELLYAFYPLVFYLSFCWCAPDLLYDSRNLRFSHPIHVGKRDEGGM